MHERVAQDGGVVQDAVAGRDDLLDLLEDEQVRVVIAIEEVQVQLDCCQGGDKKREREKERKWERTGLRRRELNERKARGAADRS